MTALKTILLTILVLLVIGAGLVFSGSIDVGADTPHSRLAQWLLSTARARSVASAARGIESVDLEDPALIAMGAAHYVEMCTQCHLAPGMKDSETRTGLNPQPPDLTQGTGRMKDAELFWIVKHGIRMTGMPAWGLTHSDRMIWAMVAFVKKLPTMTPEQYEALIPAEARGMHHDEDGPPALQ